MKEHDILNNAFKKYRKPESKEQDLPCVVQKGEGT